MPCVRGEGKAPELLEAADIRHGLTRGAPCEIALEGRTASAPTGASGWAMIAVRSTPMARASSSSASRRGLSDPATRNRSTPAVRSSETVAIVPSEGSDPDDDLDVADLAQHLGAGRSTPAVEQQVDRRVADAQVRGP